MRGVAMALCVAVMGLAARAQESGEIRLEAGFATGTVERVFRDIPIPGGLADFDGLEFDFKCDDLAAFSSFTLYFRSGGGWYSARLAPEQEGRWEHIRVAKSDASDEEGHPSGWRNAKSYRICGWRGAKRNASFQISNVKPFRENAKIAVLRATSENAGRDAALWPRNFAATLGVLGIAARQIVDSDLTESALDGIRAVILPYNPSLPPKAFNILKDFTSHGGKLLVCYVMPQEVSRLIGVRRVGDFVPSTPDTTITGFLRVGKGLAGQPDFAPQGSWRAVRAELTGDGDVVADWADRNRRSLGVPALIRTPTGLYMSHIWRGGASREQLAFMQAMVASLAPELRGNLEAVERKAEQRAAEQRRLARSVGLKPGERRFVWCHTPYGYDAEHDWEASVKLMKDTGYTDLIANLCWGGVAYYRSSVLPVASFVKTSGDALDLCLAACRRHGIRLHVWKVCWKMGSSVSDAYRKKMQAAGRTQVLSNGKPDNGWFCPSNPENRQVEVDTMLELARRGVDGVHFDYIRYDGSGSCFCDGCRRRFETKIGASVPDWPKDLKNDAALNRKWLDFRRDNISAVVRSVYERLKSGKGARPLISAAVFPAVESCPDAVGQDWPLWCRKGWLDFVCPMDYTLSTALFRGQLQAQIEAAGKVKVYPGIGLSCWVDDGEDLRRLSEQIEVVRGLGLDGFTVFALSARAATAFRAFVE